MQFSRFNTSVKTDDGNIILFNSLTGAIGLVNEVEYLSIQSTLENKAINIQEQNENETIKSLINGSILIDETKDELLKAIYLSNYLLYRSDQLDLRILPTEDCNCRCVYCYESFERGEMTSETLEKVKLLLENQAPRLKSLNIGWFGGEPLIALKTIQAISQKVIELKNIYHFKYTNQLTTNGYFLTEKVVQTLFKYEINNIQVTLDGYEEKHDERKKLKSGKGTFKRIIDNLKRMATLEDEYQLTARINFDFDNYASIKILLIELKKIFKNDKRFSVFFRPTGNWGGDNEIKKISLVSNEEKVKLQKELMELFYESTPEKFNFPQLNLQICYASLPHCYTIGSDASLYKCTVYFENELNKVGYLDNEGNLKLDINKISQWVACGDNDQECSSCYLYPACRGKNCAASRIVGHKKICPDMKYMIKENLIDYYQSLRNQ